MKFSLGSSQHAVGVETCENPTEFEVSSESCRMEATQMVSYHHSHSA